MTTLFKDSLTVINLGVGAFADNVIAAGGRCVALQWQPPAQGDRDGGRALADIFDDPRVEQANATAFARFLEAQPVFIDIAAARDVLPGMSGDRHGPRTGSKRMIGHQGMPVSYARSGVTGRIPIRLGIGDHGNDKQQSRGGSAMKTVAHILKSKPDQTVYTISPAATVFEAVKLMAEKSIGALLVMDGEKIVGIITERDYARRIVLMARSSKDTPVRDIMSTLVLYVRPDQTSEDCMVLMTQNRLRHLPVLDGGKLSGILSIGDLVKDIISEQRFIIEQLEHYISGERG